MRLIFLDVDGVLNSPAYYERCGYQMPWPHLDPAAVALLDGLVRR